jgi:Heavy metal binding domain
MHVRVPVIVAAAFASAAAPAAQLPALSWTCPMHLDVLEAKSGACGVCGMDLVPVRLVLTYVCPVHSVIEQAKPGTCRICSRELVQKTAALTFTCAGNRDGSQIEPRTCSDGSAAVPLYTPRPHGDHNPKHGGMFFMAPDNWHHLEGTFPAPGRFRVYIYDEFSRPLSVAQARNVRGRIVTKEALDPKTGTTREVSAKPLVLALTGGFFEARLDTLAIPARITAKIAFTPYSKESRFDFAFTAYSRDVPAPAAAATTVAPSTVVPSIGLIDELKARRAEIEALLRSGALGGLYVPALRAKDLALEVQAKQPDARREAIEPSVKQIVVAAYQLDNYGDLGDGLKAQEAFRAMSNAVTQLDSLVSEPRR